MSGINKAFYDGRKWLKKYLLFEVSEGAAWAETHAMGELQRQLDADLIKEMQNEPKLHTCPGR